MSFRYNQCRLEVFRVEVFFVVQKNVVKLMLNKQLMCIKFA